MSIATIQPSITNNFEPSGGTSSITFWCILMLHFNYYFLWVSKIIEDLIKWERKSFIKLLCCVGLCTGIKESCSFYRETSRFPNAFTFSAESPKILWYCPLSEKSRLCLYMQISFKGFGLIWDRRMDQDHLTAECLPFQKRYGVNLNSDITFLLKVAQHIDLHGYQNVPWPHWIRFCCTNK